MIAHFKSQAKDISYIVIYVNKMYITPCIIWLLDVYDKENSLLYVLMHYNYSFHAACWVRANTAPPPSLKEVKTPNI